MNAGAFLVIKVNTVINQLVCRIAIMGYVLPQIRANVIQVGSTLIVPLLCANKHVEMEEIALDPTRARVQLTG